MRQKRATTARRSSPLLNLIEESGTTPGGDTFENLAVYVTRIDADDKGDRLWSVDLDTEACLEFWARIRTEPATDSRGQQDEEVTAGPGPIG
jgi:hypothetical protein